MREGGFSLLPQFCRRKPSPDFGRRARFVLDRIASIGQYNHTINRKLNKIGAPQNHTVFQIAPFALCLLAGACSNASTIGDGQAAVLPAQWRGRLAAASSGAIAGQAFVLLVFVVVCLFRLFAALVGVISPGLERVFVLFDMFVLYAVGLIYIVWCVYFAWKSLDGRDLEYPLIGARLRNRSE